MTCATRWTTCLLLLVLGCAPAPSPRRLPAPANADAAPAAELPDAATVAAVRPDAAPAAPLPPGCFRRRSTSVYRCSGVPPGPDEPDATPTTVCDLCLVDGDCKAQRGGRCLEVGGHPCVGPAHLDCRYPSAACGGGICAEPVPPMPPSAPPR